VTFSINIYHLLAQKYTPFFSNNGATMIHPDINKVYLYVHRFTDGNWGWSYTENSRTWFNTMECNELEILYQQWLLERITR
jgi:hypothetical protein